MRNSCALLMIVFLLSLASGGIRHCQPPVEELCGNGEDDDGDGLVDCEDVDCLGPGEGIAITEIQPFPQNIQDLPTRLFQWVELLNRDSKCLDLSGWTLVKTLDMSVVLAIISDGTILKPDGFHLIGGDAEELARCGVQVDTEFIADAALGQHADRIGLVDQEGTLRASAFYEIIAGGPCSPGVSVIQCGDEPLLVCGLDQGEYAPDSCPGNYGTPSAPNEC